MKKKSKPKKKQAPAPKRSAAVPRTEKREELDEIVGLEDTEEVAELDSDSHDEPDNLEKDTY